VSGTPREKFLKSLQKTIKTSTSATERTAARKLFSEMTFGIPADGKSSGDITLPELPKTLQRQPSEFDETARQMMAEHLEGGLGTLLSLLHVPVWMSGCWSRHIEGWKNAADNNKLLTFADARLLVADRIEELGLDAQKVWAYPDSHCSTTEWMGFIRADFATQMTRFRKG
jgi:hypothetical protein